MLSTRRHKPRCRCSGHPDSYLPQRRLRRTVQLNKTVQNLVFTMLKDDSEIAAKKSLDIMVDLYRKKVWVVSKSSPERLLGTHPVVVYASVPPSPHGTCPEIRGCGFPRS